MKRILTYLSILFGMAFLPLLAIAQSSTHAPFTMSEYYAIDYAQWGIKSQNPNTYLFAPVGLCTASASGGNFFPFATNAPVYIYDATPANSEVVTPSSVTNQASQCGFTASPSNNHYSFQILSGTAGLQEALNTLAVIGGTTTAYPAKIDLDRNWWITANSVPGTSGSAILTASKGNAHAIVVDVTTGGSTTYVWNGTTYATGTWVNTAPTIAAGSAAGTAPTVTNAATSTQLATVANVTTGTATTTGVLFTETYVATSSGGFGYIGACTVSSIGPNILTGLTVAVTKPGTQMIVTVTSTVAPIISTAYKIQVNCK